MRRASPYSTAPSSRPPSDGSSGPGLRKSSSSRSLASQYDRPYNGPLPPVPAYPDGLAPPTRPFIHRNDSSSSLSSLPSSLYGAARPLLPPSAMLHIKAAESEPSFIDPSPPSSPIEETPPEATGPTTTSITEQMKCKVFLQEQHAKWKSLGSSNLKLYHESPTNVKQLVVQSDAKKPPLISTIVLPDGVERIGKTGVAIGLSDKGQRTASSPLRSQCGCRPIWCAVCAYFRPKTALGTDHQGLLPYAGVGVGGHTRTGGRCIRRFGQGQGRGLLRDVWGPRRLGFVGACSVAMDVLAVLSRARCVLQRGECPGQGFGTTRPEVDVLQRLGEGVRVFDALGELDVGLGALQLPDD